MAKKGLISMEIKGFDELEKNIKALRKDFDSELKKAIRRFGKKVILKEAMDNYQKNFTMRSGKGLDSFKMSVTEKEDEIYAVITAGGGEACYVPFQELGTSKMEARPFLRPAVDENAEAIIQGIQLELVAVIKKAERRVR